MSSSTLQEGPGIAITSVSSGTTEIQQAYTAEGNHIFIAVKIQHPTQKGLSGQVECWNEAWMLTAREKSMGGAQDPPGIISLHNLE